MHNIIYAKPSWNHTANDLATSLPAKCQQLLIWKTIMLPSHHWQMNKAILNYLKTLLKASFSKTVHPQIVIFGICRESMPLFLNFTCRGCGSHLQTALPLFPGERMTQLTGHTPTFHTSLFMVYSGTSTTHHPHKCVWNHLWKVSEYVYQHSFSCRAKYYLL